jgi:hypothetical protein
MLTRPLLIFLTICWALFACAPLEPGENEADDEKNKPSIEEDFTSLKLTYFVQLKYEEPIEGESLAEYELRLQNLAGRLETQWEERHSWSEEKRYTAGKIFWYSGHMMQANQHAVDVGRITADYPYRWTVLLRQAAKRPRILGCRAPGSPGPILPIAGKKPRDAA